MCGEHREIIKICTFDGGYSRTGEISVYKTDCSKCGVFTLCILIDGSDCEYAPGTICQRCSERAFTDAILAENKT